MKNNPSNKEIFAFLEEALRLKSQASIAELLEVSFNIPEYMAQEFLSAWREQRDDDIYFVEVIYRPDGHCVYSVELRGFEALRREYRELFMAYYHDGFKILISTLDNR